jgi:hypothetical protein
MYKIFMFILIVITLIFINNCTLQRQVVSDSNNVIAIDKEDCEYIDTMYKMWGGFSAGFAILSGAGGVSTIPFDDNKDTQIGIGITSLICGAFSAVSVWMQNSYASDYTNHCIE